MSTQLLALAARYFFCAAATEEQVLAEHQVADCTTIYAELQQAFTDVDGLEAFKSLVQAERAQANRDGHQGFRNWVRQNPQLVQDLQAEPPQRLATFNF